MPDAARPAVAVEEVALTGPGGAALGQECLQLGEARFGLGGGGVNLDAVAGGEDDRLAQPGPAAQARAFLAQFMHGEGEALAGGDVGSVMAESQAEKVHPVLQVIRGREEIQPPQGGQGQGERPPRKAGPRGGG